MGRPKTYERDALVERAMQLFWLHGFHGTSTQALVEALNVNRYSLYAEFGSKQGIYEAALERYEARVVTKHFHRLEAKGAGLAEARAVIASFTGFAGAHGSEHGCLLCNTATERSPHDPSSRGFVERYVVRIAAAFEGALRNASACRELREGVDPESEARFLAASMLGFWVLLRSQVDPEILRGAGRAALAHLDRLDRAHDGPAQTRGGRASCR